MKDGVLSYDGKRKEELLLWSETEHKDFELVCDFRPTGGGDCALFVRGGKRELAFKAQKQGVWHRAVTRLQGNRLSMHIDKKIIGENVEFDKLFGKLNASGPIALG